MRWTNTGTILLIILLNPIILVAVAAPYCFQTTGGNVEKYIYIYIHIYTHTYIHIYIYIYIHIHIYTESIHKNVFIKRTNESVDRLPAPGQLIKKTVNKEQISASISTSSGVANKRVSSSYIKEGLL